VRIIAGIDAFHPAEGRAAHIALGTFDGLHRGHRAVLDALLAAARPAGEAVVTTFDPHPLAVLAPPPHPFLLSTLAERLDLVAAAGADAVLVLRYDEQIRDVTASQWLDLLAQRIKAAHVVVASTHTFGHNREGTAALLQAWGRASGVNVTIVPLVRAGGRVVSSSGIRELLQAGDVRTAAAWLGRWYGVSGQVIPGEGRGRTVGIPTANLQVPPEKLIPATGVYAAFATLRGETYRSAVNIGVRPTFGGGRLSVEAHLLDADVDAYGERLDLAFVERLRDEMRFSGVADLVAQIQADLKRAAAALTPSPAVSGRESL
jgi:riboflavin kinase/FMN adenylyltransferase